MESPTSTRPIEILLVEDNAADVRLTQEALKRGRVPNVLRVVRDGAAALDYLYQRGAHADAMRPDLILLDLNMPRKDGREVLAEIKSAPALKRIPIVILTTSHSEEDVMRAYGLHANAYITKPVDLPKFMEVIRTIEVFWLTIVTLPSRQGE